MPTRKKTPGDVYSSEQHEAAMEEYEKGIRLFQQKDYAKAVPRFEAVLEQFAGEAALGDRCRMYLRICRQEGAPRRPQRQTRDPEHAFEVGVYLLNLGEYKEAARHLERAAEHEPKDPHIQLSLASARIGAGDTAGCMAALTQAVELDRRAKVWIQAISDFDDLEDEDAFLELLHGD